MFKFFRPRVLVVLLAVLATGSVCESEGLSDGDRRAVLELLNGGLTLDDPYVKSETLRIMALTGDPKVMSGAVGLASDPSPMVRVAAIRILLASGNDEARSLALNGFAQGKNADRRAVLQAVYEYGDASLQRELTARALRAKDPWLKREAFELGQLRKIDEAVALKKTKLLERTLYPELGKFVTDRDPLVGALALRKFLELGRTERAQPILEKLENGSPKEKIEAVELLSRARAKIAIPAFKQVISAYDAAIADNSLGIPDEVVPPALLRYSILGAVSAGDESLVERANAYRVNATEEESIEVLEALSANPAEESMLALRNAMKDARTDVRQRAIDLYSQRTDADPKSLNSAAIGADHDTQTRLSRVLIERFTDEWAALLRKQLTKTSEVDTSLRLLRDVIKTPEDAVKLLSKLKTELTLVSKDKKPERAELAAYLLAIGNLGGEPNAELIDKLDDPTRFSYLEFAVIAAPKQHAKIFRKYFNNDLYAIRIVSGVGLLKAFAKPTSENVVVEEPEKTETEPTE